MSNRLRFGAIEVRPDERRLFVAGRPVPVGARAFDVLQALVERRDRVVPKDELLAVVWPRAVVEENNLQVHISALRKLLGPGAILTVPGRGYRFTAEPTPLPPDEPADRAARASPSEPGGNLPARLPELYGRDGARAAVQSLLGAQALVTVVGAGGIGKTRLAQAVAHRLRQRFTNGVWMVELASLADPALVVPTVARVLGIGLAGHGPAPLEQLVRALRSRSLLLVLDNCEHLLDAAGELAAALVEGAAGVQLLATSQQPLRIAGEQVFRLAPLAVPASGDLSQPAEFGAVRLFLERVRAHDPAFSLTDENTAAVIDICRRLDGMPLAIEFASARVPTLGVQGIQDHLAERFRLLTAGERLSQPRHRTLRAALDWSHQLLDPAEQRVFRRLGVFVGDFCLEAAREVAADAGLDAWAVVDRLGALVDKSLVLADRQPRPRYRLLETARAYALDRLAEAGEEDAWRRRHAEVTQALLDQAAKRRDTAAIAAEMNNIRGACAWACGPQGDALLAVSLATSSAVVLAVEGFVSEALDRLLALEPVVAASRDGSPLPDALAARYWAWLGRLGRDGRLPVSRCLQALQHAEAMFRQQANVRKLHACLRMRAEALLQTGDLPAAHGALEQAEQLESDGCTASDRVRRLRVRALLLDAGGRTGESLATAQQAHALATEAGVERYILVLLGDMAGLYLKLGRPGEAETAFRAVAAKARAQLSGGLTLSHALAGLTLALLAQDRLDAAYAVAIEAVPLLHRSGLFPTRCDLLALLMARRGRLQAAARLAGAADAFRRRSESRRDAAELLMRGEVAGLLQASCSGAQIEGWLAAGALSEEDALVRLFDAGAADSGFDTDTDDGTANAAPAVETAGGHGRG